MWLIYTVLATRLHDFSSWGNSLSHDFQIMNSCMKTGCSVYCEGEDVL